MNHYFKDAVDTLIKNYPLLKETLALDTVTSQLPLYLSVDIRTSFFKSAVVDANLFPAGFNNLYQPQSSSYMSSILKNVILNRESSCQRLLIVCEDHTRNLWYLENVHILKKLLINAGFKVDVASMLTAHPFVCEKTGSLVVKTQSGENLTIYCLEWLRKRLGSGDFSYDLVLLNNDLISGIPYELEALDIPIYPSKNAGWHARSKSHHFEEVTHCFSSVCSKLGIDPWFFTTHFQTVNNININDSTDRDRLQQSAELCFDIIQQKYDSYEIDERPHVFIKANQGTYGMGVIPIEKPEDIKEFNRKIRNRLSTGKQSHQIRNFIIQEGIPSHLRVNNMPAEECMYFAGHHILGGFYRLNDKKNNRENLNSTGMQFSQLLFDFQSLKPSDPFFLSYLLGLISVISAHQEIKVLQESLT